MERDLVSRLAIKNHGFFAHISLEDSKLFLTAKSFFVMSSIRGTKNFAKLLEGVLIADKIGLDGRNLSDTYLWVLKRPYRTPKLEPLVSSFEIVSDAFNFLDLMSFL